MNIKKSVSNEVYYEDQMRTIWLEYGHPADEEQLPACEKEVK